jgi:integrase
MRIVSWNRFCGCRFPLIRLLVGFTGVLRRSELVALDVRDVRWTREGMIVTIRSSKMDQEGEGTELAIPFGPSRRLVRKAWLEFSGIKSGPIMGPIAKSGEIVPRAGK